MTQIYCKYFIISFNYFYEPFFFFFFFFLDIQKALNWFTLYLLKIE